MAATSFPAPNSAALRNPPNFWYERNFPLWLGSANGSLILSFYRQNQIISLGLCNDGKGEESVFSLWLNYLRRPTGLSLGGGGQQLWVGTAGALLGYANSEKPSEGQLSGLTFEHPRRDNGCFDGHYVPRVIYLGADRDIHDIAIDGQGSPFYCSAAFSCICRPSEVYTFEVYWRPWWITEIVPEDRCHLNGLCCREGVPRYVTAISMDNVARGWQSHRLGSGVVIDIVENRVVCGSTANSAALGVGAEAGVEAKNMGVGSGALTMPHSPRWYRGRLWVLNSGCGEFGWVDLEKGVFVPVCFIPGFLRGLTFTRHYAIVTASEDRHEEVFASLPLGQRLAELRIEAQCGIFIINLNDFAISHYFTFKSPHSEIYDVVFIPGVMRPMLEELDSAANLLSYSFPENSMATKS